jgi:hypothetical protein
MKLTLPLLLTLVFTYGCANHKLGYEAEPTTSNYTESDASGLIEIRPYPNPDDVCQVIGKNSLTAELMDDNMLLIGCPKHEKGAIRNRIKEGARVVEHSRHWTLLHIFKN